MKDLGRDEIKYLESQLKRSSQTIADLEGKLIQSNDSKELLERYKNELAEKQEAIEQIKWSAAHDLEKMEQELEQVKRASVIEKRETLYDLCKEDWHRRSTAKEEKFSNLVNDSDDTIDTKGQHKD